MENLLRRLPALAGDDFRSRRSRGDPDLVPEESRRSSSRRARRSCGWRGRCRGCSAACAPRSRTSSTRCRPVAGAGRRDGARPLVRADARPRWAGATARSSRSSCRGRSARARHVIAVSRADEARPDRPLRRARGADHRDAARGRSRVRAAARDRAARDDYLLYVGAIQARKDPLAAARGGSARSGCRSSSPGPEREPGWRASSSSAAPTCAATSRRTSSPVSTAARPRSCCPPATRGSGCRCWRRWPAALPVVAANDPALREVAGDAARLRRRRPGRRDPAGARRPRPPRRRRARAGAGVQLGRDCAPHARRLPGGARVISAIVVSHGHRRGARRVAAGARAAGRRDRPDREHPRQPARRRARRPGDREPRRRSAMPRT